MSDVSLFTSDEALRAEIRASNKDRVDRLSDPDRARVQIEDDRELRMHRRMRQFAFWLFILPALIGLFTSGGSWLIGWLISK